MDGSGGSGGGRTLAAGGRVLVAGAHEAPVGALRGGFGVRQTCLAAGGRAGSEAHGHPFLDGALARSRTPQLTERNEAVELNIQGSAAAPRDVPAALIGSSAARSGSKSMLRCHMV